MKSTARRFKENETIRVNATEFDKDLSTRFDYVEIDGDTAIWHNSWAIQPVFVDFAKDMSVAELSNGLPFYYKHITS